MSELKNLDIVRGVIEAVVAVAGRRTLGSFTIKIVKTVTKTLQKEYDFLNMSHFMMHSTQRTTKLLRSHLK